METPKDELLNRFNALRAKLTPARSTEPQETGSYILSKDEFIGQDEYITQPKSLRYQELIFKPNYDFQDGYQPVDRTNTNFEGQGISSRNPDQSNLKDIQDELDTYVKVKLNNQNLVKEHSAEIDYEKNPYFLDHKAKVKLIKKSK